MRLRLLSAAVLLSLLVVSLTSRGGTTEPSPVPDALHAQAAAQGTVRVIVRLTAPFVPEGQLASPAHVMGQRQMLAGAQSTVRGHLRGIRHRVVREFSGSLPLMAIEASPDALRMLASLRGIVADVQEDQLSAPALIDSVHLIRADDVWTLGRDGTGQIVAILDTGVQKSHEFFSTGGSKVIAEACFSSNINLPPLVSTSVCPGGVETSFAAGSGLPCSLAVEGCNHGTHVAGIAAGSGPTFAGVAKGANIIAIQVFSRFDSEDFCGAGHTPCALSFTSDQIEALNYVHTKRESFAGKRIAAVNMSLGGAQGFASFCDTNPQKLAIDQLRTPHPTDPTDPGVATVIAAGNSFFTDRISSPACISSAIPVASSTKSDGISSFTNMASPSIFSSLLFAPGSFIQSSIPPGPNTYAFFSGTSMATPHVAGTFAVLRDFAPTATIDQIVAALKATGTPITDTRPPCPTCSSIRFTAPRIDVLAATSQFPPNLLVQTLTAPGAASPGANISVSTSIRNIGSAADPSNLKLYLATDAVVTTGDQSLGTIAFDRLDAGATSPVKTLAVQIPLATTPGPYFIRAVADGDAHIDEVSEADNGKTVPIQIAVPDLTVPSVTFTPAASGPGTNVSVTHMVQNVAASPGNAPASTSGIYLGLNQSFGSVLGGPIGLVSAPAVAAGATSPAITATNVNIPGGTPLGRYYVLVHANDTAAFVEGGAPENNTGVAATQILIGPDLIVTAATTATGISPGGNLSVTYTIKNQGGQAASAFDVAFALVPQAGGSSLPVGPSRSISSLAAGVTTPFTNVLAIPQNTPPATYKVQVTVDPNGTVSEADEVNNTFLTGAFNVGRADLAVQMVTFSPLATLPGGNVTVTHVVKNAAPAPGAASGSFSRLFLSPDQTVGSAVADFGLVGVPPLAGGAMATVSKGVSIPGNTSAGLYYILANADDPLTIFEANESNNLGASLTRLIVGPDVLPTGASTVTGALPGTNVSVTYTLKNQGGQVANLNVLFALMPQPSGTPISIGPGRTIPSFAAGATQAFTNALAIPADAAPGPYKIRVLADPTSDADPSNNSLLTGVIKVIRPDLIVPSVTFSPAASFPGANVTVTHTVKNAALPPGNAAATSSRLLLSPDQTVGSAVADFGLVNVPQIAAGAMATVPKVVSIPIGTAPGRYYFLANANDSGGTLEANAIPNNNLGFSQTQIIIGPDVLPTAATTLATAAPGMNVSVNYTLKNQGGVATGPFDVGFAIVPVNASGTPIGSDVPLSANRTVPTILAGGTLMFSNAVVVPTLAFGLHRIRVIVDPANALIEADETNNTLLTSGTLNVVRPDLVVPPFTFSPAVSFPGGNVTVMHSIKNQGPPPATAGPSFSRLFLSVNQSVSGEVADLGTSPVPAIPAGATVLGSRFVPLPGGVAPGLYYFGTQADATGLVLESDESDLSNYRFSQTRIVVGPDLVPTVATLAPVAIAPGLNVSVTNTIKNQGGAAAGPFDVGFYLSTDNVLDGSDTLLTTRRVPSLAAGALDTKTTPVPIPGNLSSGTYFLIVRADSAGTPGEVIEADETNNTLATTTLRVERPDLKMQSVAATPLATAVGANISVTHVVMNQAPAPGNAGPTTTRLFLSTTTSPPGGAPSFFVDVPVPAIPAGGTVTLTRPLTIPAFAPGKYFVVAQANALNSILESDSPSQANDVAATATPILLGPDLVVTAATAPPASLAPGANVSVTSTVKNQGGPGAGGFDVGFYLSSSSIFDGSAVLLTSRRVTGLAPAMVSTATTPVPIPSNQSAGDYFVIVRADIAPAPVNGEVDEADETNNTRATASIKVVRPDPSMQTVTATPAALAPTGNISVTQTIKNVSPPAGGAPGTTSRLYLSDVPSPIVALTKPVIGDVPIPPIAGGATVSVTQPFPLPAGTVPGKYWIYAQANAVNPITEGGGLPPQDNNLQRTATPIVVGPDLTLTALTVPASATPNLTIPIVSTVKNQGGQGTNGSVVRLFLSLSGALDGSEIPLGVTSTAALGPGAFFTTTTRVTIPGNTSAGAIFVLAQADSGVPEADETNNIFLRSVNIFPPNLQIVSITTPAAVIRGRVTGAPTVSVVVKNTANPAISVTSAPFSVQVFASRDDAVDAQVPGSGDLIFSKTVPALAPGATVTVTGPIVISDVRLAGNYFVSATADPTGAATGDTSLGDNSLTLTSKVLPVLPDMTKLHSVTVPLTLTPACGVTSLNLSGTINFTSQSVANPSSFAFSVNLSDPGAGFSFVYTVTGTVRAVDGSGTPGAIVATFTYSGGGRSGTGTISGSAPGLDFAGGVITGHQTNLPACSFTGTIGIVPGP